MVFRDSVRIALAISLLNELDVLACDIQNVYLREGCRERVWVVAGPEYGSEDGKNMLVIKAIYGLKSSGTVFRAFLVETLGIMSYRPSYADPDL